MAAKLKKDELTMLAEHGPVTQGYNLVTHRELKTYGVSDPEGQAHFWDDQGHAFETVDQARSFAITKRWMRVQI